MTYPTLPPALVLVAFSLLSACGDALGALEFSDGRDRFETRRDSLQDRASTAYTAVPDGGTQTFRGEAALGAGDADRGVYLIGDAQVTIDFENNTASGSMGDFGGFDTTEEYSDYQGTLILQSGVLGAPNPNDVTGQITGTLTGEDYVIGVDAAWAGDLRGTPIRGVLGNTIGRESTFTLNGDQVAGGIMVAVTP